MQNISTGVVASMVPVGVKPRDSERWPSWKIHTMAPNVAVRLSRLSSTAFTGTSSPPNIRNSKTKVTSAMMPPAQGRRPISDAFESTNWADGPPTKTLKGDGTARTSLANCSPR